MDIIGSVDDHAHGRRTALEISIALWGLADRAAVEKQLRERVVLFPGDLYASLFLVQILCWAERRKEAERIVEGLLAARDLGRKRLQEDLLAKFDARSIRSEYVIFPNSTMQNIGFLGHVLTLKNGRSMELLTKITTEELMGTELLFHERVAPASKAMASLAPGIVDVRKDGRSELYLLTMERVVGLPLVVDGMGDATVDGLLDKYQALLAFPWKDVVPDLRERPLEIGLSHAYLVSAFQGCDRPGRADAIHSWLARNVNDRGYAPEVQQAVRSAITLMHEHRVLERLDPAVSFTLLHGDLHRNNVLVGKDRSWIIDWGKMAIGPRGIDLAVLFRRFPFDRTLGLLERNKVFNGRCDLERITFSYALIVVSVMIDIDPIKHEPPDHLFLPAVDFIANALN
ncbi:MAG: aminoglycoside phosphotransferase family protein [Flavobacteriales bacterium]|nr:aminoglycoside phosphotransferase family protein [Flavobacteriales bacterium]MCB9193636.1 aminoglycoside phosphotransferase family protein [Flavobacteriales bacterium]